MVNINDELQDPVLADLLVADDAKLVCDMLREHWPDDPGINPPQFVYTLDSTMMDSRFGSVRVYSLGQSENIASCDYSTVTRRPRLSVDVASPNREMSFKLARTVYAILMRSRRAGVGELGPYTYLEVTNRKVLNDANGWYHWVFDLRLTGWHIPEISLGT